MTWLRKPKLEPRNREDIDLYSLDDLRREYFEQEGKLIRFRDSILTRDELVAEIRWRIDREERRFWATLWATIIAALGALIAAAPVIGSWLCHW